MSAGSVGMPYRHDARPVPALVTALAGRSGSQTREPTAAHDCPAGHSGGPSPRRRRHFNRTQVAPLTGCRDQGSRGARRWSRWPLCTDPARDTDGNFEAFLDAVMEALADLE